MNNFFISDSYNHFSHKKVSIMAVVRSSIDDIVKMIENVFSTCNDPSNIEMLIRMDDDDEDVILLSINKIFHKYNIKLYVGFRHGYIGMHKYCNELISMAIGDIIFHWGDDGDILTNGWEDILAQHIGGVAVLQNMVHFHTDSGIQAVRKNNFSPVVPRSLYDILGTYSPCALSDSYYDYIGEISGIKIMSGLDVLIHRGEMNKCGVEAWGHFASKENMEKIEEDAQKIIKYLDKKNICRRLIPYFEISSDPSPKVEVRGGPRNHRYVVKFFNKENGEVVFSKTIPRYNWVSCNNGKFVRVIDNGNIIFEHSFGS